MYRIKFFFRAYISIVVLSLIMAFTTNDDYKQIRIPLGNDNGVPLYKQDIGYFVGGFDIDERGYYYFLGGDNPILACFKGNELVYRKRYDEFKANQIYILNDKLYIFDYKYGKNSLFVLDKADGSIIGSYKNIIKNRVNSFLFMDTSLIMEVFDNKKKIDMSTQMGFAMFDLTGKFIKQVSNRYNLSKVVYPNEFEVNATQFLGAWNNNFVYWDYDIDNKLYMFTLRNKEGKLIGTTNIDKKFFGKPFYGNPVEHKRLKNDNIYILSRDGNDAVITVLPLNVLFSLILPKSQPQGMFFKFKSCAAYSYQS